jgi:hypothetical protein
MSDHPMASISSAADNHRGLRAVALAAVIIGVLALAAAAFLLSYSGIHAIALSAGVSRSLARIYPLIFDAMLVIASAAVLSLRGGGLLARCYAWLSMLALLVAAAAADALHATGTKLPHRPAAAAVAIIPWALVLIGFGLLLSMLRHTRQRIIAAQEAAARDSAEHEATAWRDAAAQGTTGQGRPRTAIPELLSPPKPADVPTREIPATRDVPAFPDVAASTDVPATRDVAAARDVAAGTDVADVRDVTAGTDVADVRDVTAGTDLSAPKEAAPVRVAAAATQGPAAISAPAAADLWTNNGPDLAIDTDPGLDDPTSDEARLTDQPGTAWVPRARDEQMASTDVAYSGGYRTAGSAPGPGTLSPAPTSSDLTASPASSALSPAPAVASQDLGMLSPAPTFAGHDPNALSQGPAVGSPGETARDAAAGNVTSPPSGAPGQPADDAAEPGQAAGDDAASAAPGRPALPQLRRMWSSPTPPEN